ncbi:helix-turn-helix domain-containing protein [Oscillospiraceae bacterium OttesenSCG-928-F05]|nr:helix-turn-helix domain-containing protein [Oscillospiraceae bacterium OttesenSCG-928-F05]
MDYIKIKGGYTIIGVTRLKRMRIDCGLTAKEIARAAGISGQRLSVIEAYGCCDDNKDHIISAYEYVIDRRLKRLHAFKAACNHDKYALFEIYKEGST